MKKYLFYAASALAVVGCSNDDYLGNNDGNVQNGNSAISFAGGTGKITRANDTNSGTQTLQKNGFWVYGTKNTGSGEQAKDQLVYKNYRLIYDNGTGDGNSGQSTTNSSSWEYVGVDNSQYRAHVTPALGENISQEIKYWDYSANSYTFYAATAKPEDLTGGNVEIKKGENDDAAKYTVNLKAGADLSQLYFADKVEISKSDNSDKTQENKYGGIVKLNFRSPLAKVRVAFFETIPGYSVNVEKFYYSTTDKPNQTAESTNFFAADVPNKTPRLTTEGTDFTVTFDTDKHAQMNFTNPESKNYITLGSNIKSTDKLGENTTDATYDQADKAYTYVLPQTDNSQPLKLKVDYTLTSLDGSKEKIEVKGATASIPADYLKWKNNYAYTYIFKISENTNGSTGGDVKGLYPITFDAVVIEGLQETITTVSDPSITTYGKGAVANEYKANTNIYVSVAKYAGGSAIDLNQTNTKLYKATATGMEVTEANVAHCLENGKKSKTKTEATEDDTWTVSETVGTTTKTLQLTTNGAPARTTETSIPESDVQGGGAITGKFMKFTPTAKGTYVFEYTDDTDADNVKKYYKVIKVVE